MRIFYAADTEPFPGNNLWHNNLYLPLVDLGHQIITFDYNLTPHFQNADPFNPNQKTFIDRYRPRLEKALLEQIKKAHYQQPIDVFFSYFYNAFCRPEIIREIKAMGICTINWYCNASYQFHLVKDIAPAFDCCLVPEKFRLDDYRCIGANPIYCQEAANPNFYKPFPLTLEFDVTFVGQKYGDRSEYIKSLLDAGIDVHIWGKGWQQKSQKKQNLQKSIRFANRMKRLFTYSGWKTLGCKLKQFISSSKSLKNYQPTVFIPPEICGPTLSDEELVKMYSRSKISLGFSSCGETHLSDKRILQIRLRDFEAPMSGAFYLVEYMDELEEFFSIGKEIVCYYDKKDLVEKAKYYLRHDAERELIRQAGYRRAIGEHTWQKRFNKVFREIGLI